MSLLLLLLPQAGAHWRLSFSLAELSLIRKLSTGWVELYKSLKLLRDIHMKEGATPSYVLKSIVFNYVFKENATWKAGASDQLISHVIVLLRRLERRRVALTKLLKTSSPTTFCRTRTLWIFQWTGFACLFWNFAKNACLPGCG